MNSNLRKLRYRAWHRGFREMDILMGGFADDYLDDMTEDELAEFESILNLPDQDVYEWITGRRPTPLECEGSVYKKLRGYCRKISG